MAENSLTRSTESGVLDAEAMVRGVLRAIEHLGLAQPAGPSSVVLEELPAVAEALALPPGTVVPAITTPMLRRPRAASAIDHGESARVRRNRGSTVPEAAASGTSEREPQPPPTMAQWAVLDCRLEAVQANSRRIWAEKGEVLREFEAYLVETPYGRQFAGPWANRVDGLREDREVVSAARRARRERREAEPAAALAREEILAAERDALIARKRLEAAEEKHREALNRADRATVSLAPAARRDRPHHQYRRNNGPIRSRSPPSHITSNGGTTPQRRWEGPVAVATIAGCRGSPPTGSVRMWLGTTKRDHGSATATGEPRGNQRSPPPLY